MYAAPLHVLLACIQSFSASAHPGNLILWAGNIRTNNINNFFYRTSRRYTGDRFQSCMQAQTRHQLGENEKFYILPRVGLARITVSQISKTTDSGKKSQSRCQYDEIRQTISQRLATTTHRLAVYLGIVIFILV